MYSFIASRAQVALHLDEARLRIALVGDEEQPGVQPAQPVGAVDEAVARGAGSPSSAFVGLARKTCDVGGIGGRAVDRRGEVDRVELPLLAQRRAGALGAADGLLLLVEEGVSHGSISIRIRRVTR